MRRLVKLRDTCRDSVEGFSSNRAEDTVSQERGIRINDRAIVVSAVERVEKPVRLYSMVSVRATAKMKPALCFIVYAHAYAPTTFLFVETNTFWQDSIIDLHDRCLPSYRVIVPLCQR